MPWDYLFKDGGLLVFATVILPGFFAWQFLQLRNPKGSQKPTEAAVEILAFGIVNAIVWSPWFPPQSRTVWPSQVGALALFACQIILSPLLLAWIYERCLVKAAELGWITWPQPTAWDWMFNRVVRRKPYFLVLTLKSGGKIAGAFFNESYASLYPYQPDLLLNEVWQLDPETGEPVAVVKGSEGLHISKEDVLYTELFNYGEIVDSALARAESRVASWQA